MNLCRTAGFRAVRLRGDTDFSQTEHLDGWDDDGVKFVFGIDAMPNLYELVESLPEEAWTRLQRPPRYEVQTQTRARPENVKESIVVARKFKNIRLQGEYVAEFDYRPTACDRNYRVVVVWKDLEVTRGQLHLFDDTKCFFYITNDRTKTAAEIVFDANHRCDQENLIAQQKNGVRSLTAPLDTLESNEAYMVIASLAWSLKAWPRCWSGGPVAFWPRSRCPTRAPMPPSRAGASGCWPLIPVSASMRSATRLGSAVGIG